MEKQEYLYDSDMIYKCVIGSLYFSYHIPLALAFTTRYRFKANNRETESTHVNSIGLMLLRYVIKKCLNIVFSKACFVYGYNMCFYRMLTVLL